MQGSDEFIANKFQSMPVAITVEGSNTLTRSLIVFGQGLNRAHPQMQDLIGSIQAGNDGVIHRHLFKLWDMRHERCSKFHKIFDKIKIQVRW